MEGEITVVFDEVHARIIPYVRMTQRSARVNPQAMRYRSQLQAWRYQFREQHPEWEAVTGPIEVDVDILARKGGNRRDIDNLLKAALDALNKVAWVDDSQVERVAATITWIEAGLPEQLIVRVEPLSYEQGSDAPAAGGDQEPLDTDAKPQHARN